MKKRIEQNIFPGPWMMEGDKNIRVVESVRFIDLDRSYIIQFPHLEVIVRNEFRSEVSCLGFYLSQSDLPKGKYQSV